MVPVNSFMIVVGKRLDVVMQKTLSYSRYTSGEVFFIECSTHIK